MKKIQFSIKMKLYLLLTCVIVGTIGYIIYSTINTEAKDKINNAQQSQLTEVKLANEKLLAIINPSLNTMRNIGSINPTSKTAETYKNDVDNIIKNQTEIKHLYISEVPLVKNEKISIKFSNSSAISNVKIENNNEKYLAINMVDRNYDLFNTKVLVYTALISLDEFQKDFNYLIQITNVDGKLLYSSDKEIYLQSPHTELIDAAKRSQFKVSSLEYNYDKTQYIGGFTKPLPDLFVFVSQPKVKILAYLYQNIQRVAILGVIILCISLMVISIAANKYIVKPIDSLIKATSEVANGKFNIKINTKSNDEVGVLADSFNKMSDEIQTLLSHKVKQAQMESEMKASEAVQKTLIPEKKIVHDNFNILSGYVPASICGGDIWNYFVDPQGRLYVMIADATGHGLTSAMITFSAKTVFSVVESLIVSNQNKNLTPKGILEIANKAIFDSSKGALNMTMFIAIIDFEKNVCNYANAGHNPPWLIRKNKKIESLCGEGVRLGSSEYLDVNTIVNCTTPFYAQDKLFLYTDGIIEGTNESEEQFGKKRAKNVLLNNLLKQDIIYTLLKDFLNFCHKSKIDDDITMVLITNDYVNQKDVKLDNNKDVA